MKMGFAYRLGRWFGRLFNKSPQSSRTAERTWASTRPPAFDQTPRVAEEDLSFFPEEFVVFDLETTGLNPARNKIIEIGAILVKREQLGEPQATFATYQTLVKLSGKVPAKIAEMTGITDAMLKAEGVPLADALDGFVRFAGQRPLVAYNAQFDVGFVNEALGQRGPLGNRVYCALRLARRALPGQPSYRLGELSRGMKDLGTHRALDDCHRALIAFIVCAKRVQACE